MRIPYGICATLALNLFQAAAFAESPGDKVVEFCRQNLDRKVGNGQCAGLAAQALKAAGAQVRSGPDFPNKGDYVWGKRVYLREVTANGPKESGNLDDVRPGDIIQFRDTRWAKAHYAHHTAVVATVDGMILKTYQQNANHKQYVTEGVLRLEKLEEGWIRIYRPVASPK